jgi:BlaI family transcriptional regulator, penicillinase repressor
MANTFADKYQGEKPMPRQKSRTLTELELEIMQVVWKSDEVCVEDLRTALQDAGRPLALPSIRTMLSILMEKGYVARRQEGRAHLYRAKVSQDKAQKGILKDVVERAFEGSALDMVAAMLNTRMVSKGEIDQVKRLLSNYEKEKK